MANPISFPLYERIPRKNNLKRALELLILFLLLSLLLYRFLSLNNHRLPWLLAFACESWFTFIWLITICIKWTPVEYKTYPDRLLQRVPELPAVDMFVTTANPVLEPPIITVNTVLSLLAIDYPSHKLACYVSDDGCSPLTFYSLVEASKFAKIWVPFCKKHSIQTRAPFRYFATEFELCGDSSLEFKQEWKRMKEEYERLNRNIEAAAQKSMPWDLSGEFAVFSNIERSNHPSIIKVMLENKEGELPCLVYISREKRPKHPHHYKAGAMNVLARISGVMTNAPFMLNVDCDMFANNPQIVLHAMCFLLGAKNERESGFIQSPQIFYDGPKDDPFGNQMVVLQRMIGQGFVGIQGPNYQGTGCFHRRKIIYGSSPDDTEIKGGYVASINELDKRFGNSMEFTASAVQALSGLNARADCLINLSTSLEAAHQVAGCAYEHGTSWGSKIGWVYGSATEDVLTGLKIHARGWKSVYCTPDPPAFLGCAPPGGPATMTQQKRWATGLLEILFSKHNPFIASLTGKLQFRQCLAYLWILLWGLRSIPELFYVALPAYCIITSSNFLPKVQEPAMFIPVALFVIYNLYTLSEYFQTGQSIRAWWNNQRMARIISACAWLFGVLSIILKLLGLTETVFEVTQKDQSSSGDGATAADAGRFTFDESPIFVPCTTAVLVHLTTLGISLLGFQPPAHGCHGSGIGEFFCSAWVLLIFSPFVKGLFGKGKYGIPTSIIWKSASLALLFMCLCIGTSLG